MMKQGTSRAGWLAVLLTAVVWAPATGHAADSPAPEPSAATRQDQDVAALLEAYQGGDYDAVAQKGPALVERHPENHELRLAVANSLSWTGSLEEAVELYRPLLETEHRSTALLGLGNTYRWLGQPAKAQPLIREAARLQPEDPYVQEAQRELEREFRPRTRFSLGGAADTSDAERLEGTATHSFWTPDRAAQIELGISGWYMEQDPAEVDGQSIILSVEQPAGRLSPKLSLEYQQAEQSRLYGELSLQLPDTPVILSLGRLDWGELAFAPQAAEDGLWANHLGIDAVTTAAIGTLTLAYDWYRISDGNRTHEASLQLVPAWQPFPDSPFKWFASLYGRKADRADPRYWSPEEGFYTASAGITAGWNTERWETYGSVQFGVPLTEESATTWSASLGARHWLSESLAVGTSAFFGSSERNASRYQGGSGEIYIEKLW